MALMLLTVNADVDTLRVGCKDSGMVDSRSDTVVGKARAVAEGSSAIVVLLLIMMMRRRRSRTRRSLW